MDNTSLFSSTVEKLSQNCHTQVHLNKLACRGKVLFYFSNSLDVPVAQWLEHCVSSAKVVVSNPREHILTKKGIA